MRSICITVFLLNLNFCYAQDDLQFVMDSLANSLDMEYVSFDKLPEISEFGNYGATYVYDFLPTINEEYKGIESLFFLTRQLNSMGEKSRENGQFLDPYWDFNYSLVFATKTEGNDRFQIRNVINRNVWLAGMTLYYADLNLNLDQFNRVDNPDILGLSGYKIDQYNGSIPIVISTETATRILYFTNGQWYEYLEVYH